MHHSNLAWCATYCSSLYWTLIPFNCLHDVLGLKALNAKKTAQTFILSWKFLTHIPFALIQWVLIKRELRAKKVQTCPAVWSHENNQILLGRCGCKSKKIWFRRSPAQNLLKTRAIHCGNPVKIYPSDFDFMHNINTCVRCIGWLYISLHVGDVTWAD